MTAVAPVMKSGNGIWIGWPGSEYDPSQPLPESNPDDKSPISGLLSKKVIFDILFIDKLIKSSNE